MRVKIIQPFLPAHVDDDRAVATAFAVIVLCLALPLATAAPAAADSTGPETESAAAARAESDASAEAAYQFALAKLLAEESAFGEAQAAFERALELEGSDPYAYLEVAKFHNDLASYSRSAERRRQQLMQAAEYAGEAVRLAGENRDVLFQYAQIHFRLGEYQLSSLEIARETLEKLRAESEGDIQLLITLGQIYFMKRQPAKAADVLGEAAAYLPNHRMIQSMLVDALFNAGRLEEGEKALAKLIQIDPTNLDKRLRLAELRREKGDARGAVEVLREAPPENRGDRRLRRLLAESLYLAGDNDAAIELVDELVAGDGAPGEEMRRLRASILTSMARYRDAIDEFRPLLDSVEDAGRRFQDTVLLSRLLERIGRADEAIELLRSAVGADGEQGSLQLKLALAGVLERHDRAEEAVAMIESELAAASPEEFAVFGTALADVLDKSGRVDEALRALDDTAERLREAGKTDTLVGIDLRRLTLLANHERWSELAERAPRLHDHSNPDLRSAARRLAAQALAELGRVDEALALVDPDKAESGDERRVLVSRVEILSEHGRDADAEALLAGLAERGEQPGEIFFVAGLYQRLERYDRVVELMERLLGEAPESLQALFTLGAAQERRGEREASIAAFRRLLALEPDHPPTLNYLGYMWAERGENLEEALELILRAVALDPDNGAYVDSLGWTLYQLGRYEEAREHLEWAARLLPTDPTIFEHLGDLYLRLDQRSLAREYYEQALALDGEDLAQLRRKIEGLGGKGP